MNPLIKEKVMKFYNSVCDKRYPKGWKMLTVNNTKELYVSFPERPYDLTSISLHPLNIVWGPNPTEISVFNGTPYKPMSYKKANDPEKYKKVLVDYHPVDGLVFDKNNGNYTIADHTIILPNEDNNLERYDHLRVGYVNRDFSDYTSAETTGAFDDLMGEL